MQFVGGFLLSLVFALPAHSHAKHLALYMGTESSRIFKSLGRGAGRN
jgi:hypothetical protein